MGGKRCGDVLWGPKGSPFFLCVVVERLEVSVGMVYVVVRVGVCRTKISSGVFGRFVSVCGVRGWGAGGPETPLCLKGVIRIIRKKKAND